MYSCASTSLQPEQCCDTLRFCKAAELFSGLNSKYCRESQGQRCAGYFYFFFTDCPGQGMAMWNLGRGSSLPGHCHWQQPAVYTWDRAKQEKLLCSYSYLITCSPSAILLQLKHFLNQVYLNHLLSLSCLSMSFSHLVCVLLVYAAKFVLSFLTKSTISSITSP